MLTHWSCLFLVLTHRYAAHVEFLVDLRSQKPSHSVSHRTEVFPGFRMARCASPFSILQWMIPRVASCPQNAGTPHRTSGKTSPLTQQGLGSQGQSSMCAYTYTGVVPGPWGGRDFPSLPYDLQILPTLRAGPRKFIKPDITVWSVVWGDFNMRNVYVNISHVKIPHTTDQIPLFQAKVSVVSSLQTHGLDIYLSHSTVISISDSIYQG